jgi:hypothetical protein
VGARTQLGALALCLAGHAAAWAEVNTVAYRCGEGHGQVAYSQWACPTGQRLDQLADARTASQQTDGARLIERDQALARSMARDRQHLERQSADRVAQSLSPQRPIRKVSAQQAEAERQRHRHPHGCRAPQCFRAKVPKSAATGASSAR